MTYWIGIDEAGYGPLMGPMVVSSVCMKVTDRQVGSDMWQVLKKSIAREKRRLSGRLLVCDSKKAYSRSAGVNHLRRTVLAFAANQPGDRTVFETAGDILSSFCPQCFRRLAEYPWYNDITSRNLGADRDDILLAASILGRDLDNNGFEIVKLASRCMDVGYYNSRVDVVRNKSSVLFTEICTLIEQVLKLTPDGRTVQIVIDRQGGRINYSKLLLRMFPGMELKILKQDNLTSSYELSGRDLKVRLHFTVKADSRFMPVALASMISKYLREIMIDRINSYFLAHCLEIRPTAGYWQDGQRFIRDIETHLPDVKYDAAKLIRSR